LGAEDDLGFKAIRALAIAGEATGRRNKRGNNRIVHRALSAEDRRSIALQAGIHPKGWGGSIAEHVTGRYDTGYISASLAEEGAEFYESGSGIISIDVDMAISLGTGYVDHQNVLQAIRRGHSRTRARDLRNATRAKEVLFVGSVHQAALFDLR
jgi:hypothetical protein